MKPNRLWDRVMQLVKTVVLGNKVFMVELREVKKSTMSVVKRAMKFNRSWDKVNQLGKTVIPSAKIQARKPTMLGVKMVLKSNVFWEKVKKLVKAMKSVMMSGKVVEFPLMWLSRVSRVIL